MNFIEQLKQIPDHRHSRGKRHPLWLVMCLTLLGVMCTYHGYRPLADFSRCHWSTLKTLLNLPQKTRIPSYSTFRRVIQGVDFLPLVALLNQWCQANPGERTGQWLAIDGKSIKCTVSDYQQSYQNFISTVSAFSHQTGAVVALSVLENKHTSSLSKLVEGCINRVN